MFFVDPVGEDFTRRRTEKETAEIMKILFQERKEMDKRSSPSTLEFLYRN
jgi:hypothetical protein